MKSNHSVLRDLLKQHPDGLTPQQISEITGLSNRSVRQSLNSMFGVYIDRWVNVAYRNNLAAVWVVVDVPENCPKPESIGEKTHERIRTQED